ncbi:MAG TPA: mechanosensitive ion channel family protein [Candidatus Acidoferrales bacterium]
MTESISQLSESAGRVGLRLVVIAVLAVILIRLLRAVTARLVHTAKSPTRSGQLREQQTRTLADLLHSVGGTAVIVLAALMAMRVLGFDVAPALATAGVLSVALAFGAQSLLKDLINGFFIVFEDQYSLGDVLQVNGETGRVEHLTLRRTVLRNNTGAIVSIPNGLIGQVSNLSRDWSQTFVDITVRADEMVGQAITILDKVAAEFRDDSDWSPALVDGPRVLGVESLTLEGTVIRLQVRTILNRKDDVARELRRRIKIAFEQSEMAADEPHKVSVSSGAPSPHD